MPPLFLSTGFIYIPHFSFPARFYSPVKSLGPQMNYLLSVSSSLLPFSFSLTFPSPPFPFLFSLTKILLFLLFPAVHDGSRAKGNKKKTQKKKRNRCWGQCHQQHTVLALQTTVRLIFRGWCEFLFLLSFFENTHFAKTHFAKKAKSPHFANKLIDKTQVFSLIGKMCFWQNVGHPSFFCVFS
ncbi:unnamed protein product [Meloidogyne enterolobii]|uniref:Uncharacterized protein n=1 Tax=Meloidogyne enterolobii TaxID=390850 RepID=A0ACB0YMZ0_MELEN